LKFSHNEPVEHKQEEEEHFSEITGDQPAEMIGAEVAVGGEVEAYSDIR